MKKTQILETRDYKKFRADSSNRSINLSSLKKIIASMARHGWLAPYPLHVVPRNGALYIIDGQHRFRAAERLGISILYVICDDDEDLFVADINIAQSPWNVRDYVTSYANRGNPHYLKLLDFSEKYRLPLGVSGKLIMNSFSDSGAYAKSIRRGDLQVASSDLAEIVARLIEALRKLGVAFASNRSFIDALMRACSVPAFCQQTFLDRVKSCPGNLTLEPTTEHFLDAIELTYNYRASAAKRIPLKFLAMQVGKK
jgi:hypothetical protein